MHAEHAMAEASRKTFISPEDITVTVISTPSGSF
jgi:hypothetical protein